LIGESVKRFEDERLLTGGGRYTGDHDAPGQAHAVFLRSPHAHAELHGIDAATAMAMPGVLGIFTAADLAADGIAALPCGVGARAAEQPNRDGTMMADPPLPVLAGDRVRHVGEPVAIVVAETADQARDAAESVSVDYVPLPSVTATGEALDSGAPELWDEAPGNLVFDYGSGDAAATEAALKSAAHVVTLDIVNNRLSISFMEPRAALGQFCAATAAWELVIGCQSVHGIARNLADVLGGGPGSVRVLSPDVGGAFGARSVLYPEYVVVLWAAKQLGRAVKWTGGRDEEFQTSTHGRDALLTGTLGLDADGRMVALRVDGIANFGARHAGNGPFSTVRNFERMLPAVYDIPSLYLNIRGVFTNTTPISSYRGVGRIEANYLIERLIDAAAMQTGLDRMALRRLNAIKGSDLPKATAMGTLYDSGDYTGNMEIAQREGDWSGFAARRAASESLGRLRGIALCNYIEGAGGATGEYGRVGVAADGTVSIAAGCVDQGQGHETVMRQMVAHELGIDMAQIDVAESDTGLIKDGIGTNASRSMVRAGKALVDASRALIEQGHAIAARLLQAEPHTVAYGSGFYAVEGTDRQVSLFEVARAEPDGLFAEIRHEDDTVTFPAGCHLCEVEIDPDTGKVVIARFLAIDDVGRAVNPMIVHGQSQGGVAQGIGQALLEHVVYDADSGQLLAGSFMDYTMPRADDLPMLDTILNDCPSPFTPHGIKGAGEGGATGAPAAVINAILDALGPLGVTHIDMPATPEAVWRAIRGAAKDGKVGA
jgi:carbon-monoxide dehydrogenase large subunit